MRDRDPIVRWAWRTHAPAGERVAAARRDHHGLVVVRLRNHDEVAR